MSEKNNNLAFVFPGQGSQSVSMLEQLAQQYSEVTEIYSRASDVLGLDLWQLVSHGPKEELNQTHNTQPAMLAAGVAIWEVWQKKSALRPAWMAGHSLGEYTALVCSGALQFEDAVALVAERGRLMQQAVPAGIGAMAAILGLDDETVVTVCANSAEDEVVAAVNFNAPGQVVIAGHVSAVERAMSAAKEAGAKRAVKLPVSVPSHCSLMETAAEQLSVKLASINMQTPDVKLIHNVDALAHDSVAEIKDIVIKQLYKPVRWVDSMQYLQTQGVSQFVECGPGKVLMGLNKRIVKGASHLTIFDLDTLENALEQVQ